MTTPAVTPATPAPAPPNIFQQLAEGKTGQTQTAPASSSSEPSAPAGNIFRQISEGTYKEPGDTTPAGPGAAQHGSTLQATPEEQTPEGSAAALARRQAQYPTLTAVGQGAGDILDDLWGAIKGIPGALANSLPPVELYHSVEAALPILTAYEKARANGAGILDSLKSANDAAQQHDSAQQALQSRIADFKKAPGRASVRALGDAAMIASTLWDGGLANPANTEGLAAPEAEAEAATATAKPEGIVRKALNTFKEVPDTTNTDLQAGLRDIASKTADEAGTDAAAVEGKPIRTTFESVADAVERKSKGLYQQIDDATDGEFTNIQKRIKNVDYKLRDIAGTDDAAEERLYNQKIALNVRMDEAITAAQKAGVDPSVADSARATWKQSSALRDVDMQVKASTFGNAKNAAEIVDPSKLVTRLQKLSDSGRLDEAVGKEQSDAMLQHAYDGLQNAHDVAAETLKRAGRKAIATKAAGAVGVGAVYEAGRAVHSILK